MWVKVCERNFFASLLGSGNKSHTNWLSWVYGITIMYLICMIHNACLLVNFGNHLIKVISSLWFKVHSKSRHTCTRMTLIIFCLRQIEPSLWPSLRDLSMTHGQTLTVIESSCIRIDLPEVVPGPIKALIASKLMAIPCGLCATVVTYTVILCRLYYIIIWLVSYWYYLQN